MCASALLTTHCTLDTSTTGAMTDNLCDARIIIHVLDTEVALVQWVVQTKAAQRFQIVATLPC